MAVGIRTRAGETVRPILGSYITITPSLRAIVEPPSRAIPHLWIRYTELEPLRGVYLQLDFL